MSEAPYSPLVIDHFEQPRNVGRFAPAADVIAASAATPSRACGSTSVRGSRDDRIVALRFEVYGCPHCIAAGSLLSERLQGATQEQLRRWSWREAADGWSSRRRSAADSDSRRRGARAR